MLLHTYTPNPENEAELRKSSTALLSTLKEDGCLRYDLFLDLSDPGKFTFIEEWTSTDALDMQEIQPHHGRAGPYGRVVARAGVGASGASGSMIPWSNLCGNGTPDFAAGSGVGPVAHRRGQYTSRKKAYEWHCAFLSRRGLG